MVGARAVNVQEFDEEKNYVHDLVLKEGVSLYLEDFLIDRHI